MSLNPMKIPQGSGFHDTISSRRESKPSKETIPRAGALEETVLCNTSDEIGQRGRTIHNEQYYEQNQAWYTHAYVYTNDHIIPRRREQNGSDKLKTGNNAKFATTFG